MNFLWPQETLLQTQNLNFDQNEDISICRSSGEVLDIYSEILKDAPEYTYVRFILWDKWGGYAQIETVIWESLNTGLFRLPVVGEILHTINRDETIYAQYDPHTPYTQSVYTDSVLMLQRISWEEYLILQRENQISWEDTLKYKGIPKTYQSIRACSTNMPEKYQFTWPPTMPVFEILAFFIVSSAAGILLIIWLFLVSKRIIKEYKITKVAPSDMKK